MGALIPNFAKGKVARYADLPVAGNVLTWVLFSGVVTDAALRDVHTLTAALAAGLTEATFTGYAKANATSVAEVTDDTNDWTTVTAANPSWSPTSAQALTRIGLFFDPDGSHTAGSMVPIFFDDFAITTPTSGTISYTVATGGFAKVS